MLSKYDEKRVHDLIMSGKSINELERYFSEIDLSEMKMKFKKDGTKYAAMKLPQTPLLKFRLVVCEPGSMFALFSQFSFGNVSSGCSEIYKSELPKDMQNYDDFHKYCMDRYKESRDSFADDMHDSSTLWIDDPLWKTINDAKWRNYDREYNKKFAIPVFNDVNQDILDDIIKDNYELYKKWWLIKE